VTAPAPVPALELRGIHKRFDTVVALDDVELVVRPGGVHALLGENGAGKSTLMRIAYGLVRADAGSVWINGHPQRASVRDSMRAGAGMVHQHLSLVPALTAAENVALGGRGRLRPESAMAILSQAAERFGLAVPANARVRDLSVVEQQRLEILKALVRGARVLILDEPTAVLAPSDARALLQWAREFAAGGGAIVIVTHKLPEALSIADDITVLRRGRLVFSGPRGGVSEQELARAIFPEDTRAPTTVAVGAGTGDVVVRASKVVINDERGAPAIRGASFEVRSGEIVGIAAVEGSGHRALLRALAGLRPVVSGTLQRPDEIALIPSDRAREGLIPEFSLTENVALHGAGDRRGILPWPELEERTAALVERFAIVAQGVRAPAGSLSGGNQQRLVIARELETPKRLVVADNPTHGLDLRATAFVQDQLRAAAAAGAAVVVHSSDLDDVLALATRVLVVFHGEVREAGLDPEAIGRAMLGAGAS